MKNLKCTYCIIKVRKEVIFSGSLDQFLTLTKHKYE
ncbi:hypothetical protein CLFE_041930 [Clostridium felsineum DSM 794]|nr:hypothetical protein CLFE_041930 [Clostridium felsineum DSM 794]